MMKLFAGQQWRHRCKKQTYGRGREKGGGRRGRDVQRVTCKLITTCKTDSQWEFAVWFQELKPGLCNNLEGWDGEESWREVQDGGDIGIPMADSCGRLPQINTILSSTYLSIKKKINLNFFK